MYEAYAAEAGVQSPRDRAQFMAGAIAMESNLNQAIVESMANQRARLIECSRLRAANTIMFNTLVRAHQSLQQWRINKFTMEGEIHKLAYDVRDTIAKVDLTAEQSAPKKPPP